MGKLQKWFHSDRLHYFLASRSLEFEISNCNIRPGQSQFSKSRAEHKKQYGTLMKETIRNREQNEDFGNISNVK